MAAPGVIVTTAVRSGPTTPVRAQSGQYFVIGLAERGPADRPVKINSMADYIRNFGGRVTYGALYDDLLAFFENGGSQAYVQRVVGAGATTGTLTLDDGSSVDTVRFDAAGAGAWSSRLTVEVTAGTNPDSRRVTVRLDGDIVETYNNLDSPATITRRFARSPYVRATDLGSATAAPGNLPAPSGPTPLSAGTDDRATVDAVELGAALDRLDIALGDGAVAIPGGGAAVHEALQAHASTHRRIALLDAARGSDEAGLADIAADVTARSGAEYCGLFAPYILVADGAGGSRAISPVGYVAGKRNVAHTTGPWIAPAGELGKTAFVLGLDQNFDRAAHEVLDAARISPVRVVAGSVRLYGWRSLSAEDRDFGSLTVGDFLNRLVTECEFRLEPLVHRTIDGRGQLLSTITGILIGVLEPIRVQGGIFDLIVDGDTVDRGYTVDAGAAVNTVESLANNEVRANIAVRFSPLASLISLTIVKVGVSAAV